MEGREDDARIVGVVLCVTMRIEPVSKWVCRDVFVGGK
jgi:hypothetical protein